MTCPRCQREVCGIRESTYGGTITFYHRCLPFFESSLYPNGGEWNWACVREDGTIATNDPSEIQRYNGTRTGRLETPNGQI